MTERSPLIFTTANLIIIVEPSNIVLFELILYVPVKVSEYFTIKDSFDEITQMPSIQKEPKSGFPSQYFGRERQGLAQVFEQRAIFVIKEVIGLHVDLDITKIRDK